MNRLLTPLVYLKVRHPVKIWYSVIYPIMFSAPLSALLVFAPIEYTVVGDNGLVETFNALLALLIGFFIAALAAVASFDRAGMDAAMLGDGATLSLPDRSEPLVLTRRMYLCLLFGYLTLATLATYIVFAIANVMLASVSPPAVGLSAGTYALARGGFIFVYCFLIGHILSHSLLGVYYLAWRTVIFEKKVLGNE
ncbi:hypothetical protein [Terricaulis silvestris]|uniref:Uncharacterized protein n=1 Tax=Terricaulis silvestris TaxID=2686094 RepID=A0A6I6MUW8_9CAUL|nr:hypothetical protein [Terricaulis silvestris]QGZ94963.1 hypothetical protein DSM104635_01798 [Terricaulis silvestris]